MSRSMVRPTYLLGFYAYVVELAMNCFPMSAFCVAQPSARLRAGFIVCGSHRTLKSAVSHEIVVSQATHMYLGSSFGLDRRFLAVFYG